MADALDFSDEALEAATGETTGTAPEETAGQAQEAENQTEQTESVEQANATETLGEAEQRRFAGKYDSPEALEQAYQNLESLLGRKDQEWQQRLAEAEQQWQQALEEQAQYDDAPLFGTVPQSKQELYELAIEEPAGAFEFAANNAPHLIADVLSIIQEGDPSLAKTLELDYLQYQMQQQQEAQQYEQQTQQQQQAEFVETQHAATQAAWEEFAKDHNDYEVIGPEMAQAMAETQHLVEGANHPQQFFDWMRMCYDLAWGRSRGKIQAAEDRVAAEQAANRGQAIVESGTAGAAPTPVEPSEADSIISELLGTQSNYERLAYGS